MPDLNLVPSTTALVFIDLENGIVGRQLAPHTGQEVVNQANRLAQAFRQWGGTVVFVHVDMRDMLKLPADQPTVDPSAPPPPPEASQFVSDLDLQPSDLIVKKRQWGAFYGTNLEQDLRRRGIKTIVLGGIATNMGVESTARAAFDQGYELVFVEDATSSATEEAHRFSIKNIFPRMGRVRSTEEVLAAVKV